MNSNEIVIDGRQGEGGGQVLRTSLSLAAALGRTVVVEHVRGGRRKPGLLRQHRTALRAVRDITGGEIEGDELGSTAIRFAPGATPAGGDYRFGIGSAGSTMLVLQTVLPPLLLAGEPSTIILEGGTHNPSAPPFEFFAESFVPCLAAMGARVSAELIRPGFFPAGGGELRVSVQPIEDVRRFEMLQRDDGPHPSLEVLVAGLPDGIPEREWKAFQRKLHWTRDRFRITHVEGGRSAGNVMLARIPHGDFTAVFATFGQRNRTSESVGSSLGGLVRAYTKTDAPVDEQLADQLLLPLALLGGGSFRCAKASRHTLTNADVIRAFLPGSIAVEPDGENGEQRVTVTGNR